ncbi:MAG: hypothetical protein KY476_03035 [Planctomycetes bacterium]|nr:hypothetical protein [Planctomycetota bacterium]
MRRSATTDRPARSCSAPAVAWLAVVAGCLAANGQSLTAAGPATAADWRLEHESSWLERVPPLARLLRTFATGAVRDQTLENGETGTSEATPLQWAVFRRPVPLVQAFGESGGENVRLVGWLPTLPTFFGRVRGEYGDDFDNQNRIGGSLLLRSQGSLGLDTEWNYRRRDLPFSRHDKLWTGDANIVYQLAYVQMVSMRGGAGVTWLHNDGELDAGFNFTYGADVFVNRPWLFSGEVDWGRAGGESVFHARGTLGYVLGVWEAYGGWDYYEVGEQAFDGFVAGVSLWF